MQSNGQTEIIRLENGHQIRVAAGLSDSELDALVAEYMASEDATDDVRTPAEQAASDKRRDDFLAQQEANSDPRVAFDQVRPG